MKQKRSYKKPSFYVISSAMDGDKISIDKILDFYDPVAIPSPTEITVPTSWFWLISS